GGLDPALVPGDWVVAASVVSAAGRFGVDQTWTRALLAALPGAIHADISGIDAPLGEPAAKLSLRRTDGTAAVDTESHIAALFATREHIPFGPRRGVLGPGWGCFPAVGVAPPRPGGARRSRRLFPIVLANAVSARPCPQDRDGCPPRLDQPGPRPPTARRSSCL